MVTSDRGSGVGAETDVRSSEAAVKAASRVQCRGFRGVAGEPSTGSGGTLLCDTRMSGSIARPRRREPCLAGALEKPYEVSAYSDL